jgi:hypothetical protein
MIGFSYIFLDVSNFLGGSMFVDFHEIVGEIWNDLTKVDSARYGGGGWYTNAAISAFSCSLIHIAGLDHELRRSSNNINLMNLKPESFSNVPCNVAEM